MFSTNYQPMVLLYGQLGATYNLQTAPQLSVPVSWQDGQSVTLSNDLFIVIEAPATNQMMFFRAKQQ